MPRSSIVSCLLILLLSATLSSCGGPDQATLTALSTAEARLAAGVATMEGGEVASPVAAWETDAALMTTHGDVVVEGSAMQARLRAIAERYRPVLDAHAVEWAARFEADPEVWPRLQAMARAVGATQIEAQRVQREVRRAQELAAKQAEEARRAEVQRLAAFDQLPSTILVRTRLSPDLPGALRKETDRLVNAVVAGVQQRLEGITVTRVTKDLPLGAEGCAGAVIELIVTCEYASYARPGEGEYGAILNAAVPTHLQVHLRSRRGQFCTLELDQQLEASLTAPDTISALETTEVAKQHAKQVVDEVIGKLPAALPMWDSVAVRAQLQMAPPFKFSEAPLVTMEWRTRIGKEKGKANNNVFAATGSDELYREMVYLLARRVGPVRVAFEKAGKGVAHIDIDNTMYYRMYGTTNGMIATNNGSLPYRADLAVTVTSTGATPHPWAGLHRYAAFVDLPDQVSRSGGFSSEAAHGIATMSEQIGAVIDVELDLARSYRPAADGEQDQYLLRVLPVGKLEQCEVLTAPWFRALPAKLQASLAGKVAPATVVLSSQVVPGRVAGLITVYADGELTFVQGVGNKTNPTLEPSSLALDLHLSSAFRGTPHPWEGAHPVAVTIDRREIMKLMNQKRPDPLDEVLTKAVRAALK